MMVDECFTMVTTCLNDFPSKNGISASISPASIVDGNNLKATFGKYYKVYCSINNTNKERRTSAICIRPSNSQGGYYFMNIETGKRIHGYRFTELSMPQHIIDKVHDLADEEGAPNLDDNGYPLFEWEIGAPVNDDHEPIIEIVPVPDNEAKSRDTNDSEDEDEDTDDNDDNASTESESSHPPSSDDDDSHSDDDESISDDEPPDPQLKARSDDESLTDDSVELIGKLRSEIDAENVVKGKRNRTTTTQPNVDSFGGKKYHVNMLNIGQDAFTHFEQVKVGVKAPDIDNWHKFKCLMCWVKKRKTDVRTIRTDDVLNMFVMIDPAHAVHNDMRGHTGGVTFFGTSIIDQKSSKQKMNT